MNYPHKSRIMMVVGEASGDYLGGELIQALQRQSAQAPDITGVAGEIMQSYGASSLFPIQDLSVMGLTDILPSLPRLWWRRRQLVTHALQTRPDIIIMIDSLGFTHAVAQAIRQKWPDCRIIRYVAPKLWAWLPGRAKKLRGIYDKIITILPFESDFFRQYDINNTVFTGHSVVQRITPLSSQEKQDIHTQYCPNNQPLVAILPGSRRSEVKRLLPIFANVMRAFPQAVAVLPCLPSLLPLINNILAQHALPTQTWHIIPNPAQRLRSMAASDCALAASGTVSLELTAAHIPMLVAYKVGWLSGLIARRLIQIPYASLSNILLDKMIIPEFLQERCNSTLIIPALQDLLQKGPLYQQQMANFAQVTSMLWPTEGKDIQPADYAARVILADLPNQH